MLYLIAIFCSPLALLLALRPFQAVVNAILYILAIVGLFLFVLPGVLLWLFGVVHAFAVISSRNADRRTARIVKAINKRQG